MQQKLVRRSSPPLTPMTFSPVDVLTLFLLVLLIAYLASAPPRPLSTPPPSLSSPSLSHPQLPDIIPTSLLLILTNILPLVLFLIPPPTPALFLCLTQTLLESNIVTVFVTNVLKLLASRPRPYFASVCISYLPPPDSSTCSGDAHKVAEALKSFPSGHSSLAFSAATIVALYLATRLIYPFPSSSTSGEARSWKFVVILTPWLGAAGVAISRTIDFHHHFSDIVGGSGIGIGIGLVVYMGRVRMIFKFIRDAGYWGDGDGGDGVEGMERV